MIWGVIIFIVTLAVDLWTDVRLYFKKKKVNHFRGAALRLIGLVPACWLMGWISAPMLFFAYWVLFQGLYNKLIGKEWDFVGTTAKLDRFERKNPWFKWVRYAGLIISIAIYVKFRN